MDAQLLITNTYYRVVGTSSVSITLDASDKSSVNVTNENLYAIMQNLGTTPVFAVSSVLSSAATATFPSDSATAVSPGKVIPAGAVVTYKLTTGTNFISFISGTGSNSVATSIGRGV